MTEAVISHIQGGWQPQEFRVWRRLGAEAGCAVEATIRTGPQSAYGGSGPTRGVAVCRAALFLAANGGRGQPGVSSGARRAATPGILLL